MTDIRTETMLLFRDENYEPPTGEEVRALLRYADLTGVEAGLVAGASDRGIRYWTGGDRVISYSAWRLLLVYAGLVEPETD